MLHTHFPQNPISMYPYTFSNAMHTSTHVTAHRQINLALCSSSFVFQHKHNMLSIVRPPEQQSRRIKWHCTSCNSCHTQIMKKILIYCISLEMCMHVVYLSCFILSLCSINLHFIWSNDPSSEAANHRTYTHSNMQYWKIFKTITSTICTTTHTLEHLWNQLCLLE